jgi:hypothetical protein
MIRIGKLATGEEVVGEYTDNGDTYTIKNACAIAYVPSREQPGQQAMGLIPYAAYTKDHQITVGKDKIIWIEELVEEVYNQYNQIFGSGIQVIKGALPGGGLR